MKVDAELKKELDGVVKAYEIAMQQLTGFGKLLRQHRFDLNKIEHKTAGAVASEKGADGKAKFSNETLRQAEVSVRLGSDEEYRKLIDLIASLEDNISDEEMHVKLCKMQMKAWDIATR